MRSAWSALILGVFSVALGHAEFDLKRMPTAQDVVAIRAMGWSAGADALEVRLAEQWKPSHSSQAGSAGNAVFRQWQRLYQWCSLLGTPEPEALKTWLGRRVLRNPEQDSALLVIPSGVPLPTDSSGRPLPTAAE